MADRLAACFGASFDAAFTDPRLEEFADRMQKNTSALIFVTNGPYADEFSTAFDSFGGELIETELDEDDVKVIHNALQKLQKV